MSTIPGNEIPEQKNSVNDKGSTTSIFEVLLKKPELWFDQLAVNQIKKPLLIFLLTALVCYLGYGLILGSFSGHGQWFAAPLKVIVGTALSMLLCYPSLYIFACLSGSEMVTPSRTMALLISGMTLTSVLLVGFIPVAFVFTFATGSAFFIGIIHLLIWLISIYFGLRHMVSGMQALLCKNLKMLTFWGVILVVTMLQMSTVLRPLIGDSDMIPTGEKRFFIQYWIENIPANEPNLYRTME